MRILIVVIVIALLTGCGVVTRNVEDSTKTDNRSLLVQSKTPNTPQAIYSWININIRYQADSGKPEEEFRSAEQTLALGYGDCDDIAVLADYMLKQHGYTSEVIAVYTTSQGHAVCVWKDLQGTYNHLSNQSIREIHAQSLLAIAKDIYSDWRFYAIYPENIFIERG